MKNKHSTSRLRTFFQRAVIGTILLVSPGCQSTPRGPTLNIFPDQTYQPQTTPSISPAYNIAAKAAQIRFAQPEWPENWSSRFSRASQLSFSGSAWQSMLKRHEESLQDPAGKKEILDWMAQLDKFRGQSFEACARAVDRCVDNYITYTGDDTLYNTPEYFACPLETIRNKKGDCDDYAILKYFALQYLEVPPERIYMLLASTTKGGNLDHAVLLVDVEKKAEAPPRFMIASNDSGSFGKGSLINTAYSSYTPFFAFGDDNLTLLFMPPRDAAPEPEGEQKRIMPPRAVNQPAGNK